MTDSTFPKITCNWLHLSDHATLTNGGQAILVGIFDRFFAPQVPVIHPMSFLSFELDGPPQNKVPIRVQIRRPGGATLMSMNAECDFNPPDGRANFMIAMPNLQLPDYGKYDILISVGPDVINAARFSVIPLPKSGH